MRSRILKLLSVTLLIASILIIPVATALSDGTVGSEQKISSTQGGFGSELDSNDDFSRSLAGIGDFDGDGVADLAVGYSGDDDAGWNAGAVWLVYMNADGTVKAKTKIVPNQANLPGGGHNFGVSVADLGDIDGDGVVDLAVGNQRENGGRGTVWILFMNGDGTVKGHQKIGQGLGGFSGSLPGSANFGFATTNIGDLDGNGVNDLAVGAPTEHGGTGEVWILFLDHDGTVLADRQIRSGVGGFTGPLLVGNQFGQSVANAGDLDNDGVVDLAVGGAFDDDGGANRGAVYILFMNSNGTVASHQKISSLAGGFGGVLNDNDVFGASLAGLGDVDGDAVEDIVVGAFGVGGEGAVWLLFLNTDGTVASHQRISEGVGGFVGPTASGDRFGWSVASVGDLNQDDAPDLAVGALYDDDGGTNRGAVWVLFLSVANQDPSLTTDLGMVVVDEGDPATNTGTVLDPNGDTVSLVASVGSVVNNGDGTWGWSFDSEDGPTESQVVTIGADDGNGGAASVDFTLTVTNVAPRISAVTGPIEPTAIADQPVSVAVTFTDPSTADSHDVTWAWGDATVPDVRLGATSPAAQDHSYTDAGVYTVTATVADDDGGVASAVFQFIVVYDPDGGFVTGGGSIDSPAGACAFEYCTYNTIGMAHFGFVSKYKKGASEPTGTTQFQFQAGDLNFHSVGYDWLVIGGPNAKFKGTGTVNGAGGFGFMLTACDVEVVGNCLGESQDTFRIKIWDKANGDFVVYDNKAGSPDDSDEGTVLGGGNIKVHKK